MRGTLRVTPRSRVVRAPASRRCDDWSPIVRPSGIGAVVAGRRRDRGDLVGGRAVLGQSGGLFGGPLAGLLPAEFERFRVGLDDFLEVETAEEGLGPSFNATSCAVCHNVPAVGGVSLVSEVRAAHRDADGTIRPLRGPDGTPLDTLFHLFSNPTHGVSRSCRRKRT